MKVPSVIHAVDKDRKPGQIFATAICGKRVRVASVLTTDNWGEDAFSCIGCIAILNERRREYERARLHSGGAV